MQPWLFKSSEHEAVFTVKEILEKKAPILFVTHGNGDTYWSFMTGESKLSIEEARVVSLKEITDLDKTIFDLFDLSLGYKAVRKDLNSPWVKSKI